MKHYTTIEQSKKLLELGLSRYTADMTYCVITEGIREKTVIKDWQVNIGLDIAIKENLFSYRNGYVIPCWSLGALLEVMPGYSNIYKGNEKDDYKYVCAPISRIKEHYGNTPIEAAYSMVIWLLENGFIKKEPKTSSE